MVPVKKSQGFAFLVYPVSTCRATQGHGRLPLPILLWYFLGSFVSAAITEKFDIMRLLTFVTYILPRGSDSFKKLIWQMP